MWKDHVFVGFCSPYHCVCTSWRTWLVSHQNTLAHISNKLLFTKKKKNIKNNNFTIFLSNKPCAGYSNQMESHTFSTGNLSAEPENSTEQQHKYKQVTLPMILNNSHFSPTCSLVDWNVITKTVMSRLCVSVVMQCS